MVRFWSLFYTTGVPDQKKENKRKERKEKKKYFNPIQNGANSKMPWI